MKQAFQFLKTEIVRQETRSRDMLAMRDMI